jgi:hypothetical protein
MISCEKGRSCVPPARRRFSAGALLLRQVDCGLGLIRRFAQYFTDRRDQRFVEHSVETLARGRRNPG